MRLGFMAVTSGLVKTAVVVGVEQMTHTSGERTTHGFVLCFSAEHPSLATASDWETEGGRGETFVTLNGQLMSLYMKKYNIPHERFGNISINAHHNASLAAHSLFKSTLTHAAYEHSKMVSPPVQVVLVTREFIIRLWTRRPCAMVQLQSC